MTQTALSDSFTDLWQTDNGIVRTLTANGAPSAIYLSSGTLVIDGTLQSAWASYGNGGDSSGVFASVYNKMAVVFDYAPSYSGVPPLNLDNVLFSFGKSAAGNEGNTIELYHGAAGDLWLDVYDSSGSFFSANPQLGVWTPVSGTRYQIRVDFDNTTSPGTARVYIDGTLFKSLSFTQLTRTSDMQLARLGRSVTFGQRGFGTYDNLSVTDSLLSTSSTSTTVNASAFDIVIKGMALNSFGLTAENTVEGLGLNSFGFLWPCAGIWGPGDDPVTTAWTDCDTAETVEECLG